MRNIERIKDIPIASYLERKGIQVPARGNICAFWRGDKNPSVSIDRAQNRWYDHGVGRGGSVIDLVMAVEGCTFSQAADILESGAYSVAIFAQASKRDRRPAIVVDEVRFLQHPALLQYLSVRGISISLANIYCREIHYHLEIKPEKKYFAVGFQNREGGWELRNPGWKGATSKHYTYIDNGGSHIAIFEGFCDMLSYLELPEHIFPKRAPENLVVLNSVALARRFLCDIKAGRLGDIRTASLYLDCDDAGHNTTTQIVEAFREMRIKVLEDAGETLAVEWPGCKDINDALLHYQQQARIQYTTNSDEKKG